MRQPAAGFAPSSLPSGPMGQPNSSDTPQRTCPYTLTCVDTTDTYAYEPLRISPLADPRLPLYIITLHKLKSQIAITMGENRERRTDLSRATHQEKAPGGGGGNLSSVKLNGPYTSRRDVRARLCCILAHLKAVSLSQMGQ